MTLNCVEVVTTEELGIDLVEAEIAVDVGVEAFERAVKYSNNDGEAIFLRIAQSFYNMADATVRAVQPNFEFCCHLYINDLPY